MTGDNHFKTLATAQGPAVTLRLLGRHDEARERETFVAVREPDR